MTIRDIARESGYAVGTVSRVLNNRPDVSPSAREKIMAVVAAHGFTPNANAKHLKQQGSQGIAVVVKGTRNMLFAGILELVQEELRRRGYPVFVIHLEDDEDEVLQARQLCLERKPLGIVFLGSNLRYFEEEFSAVSVPCVLVTNSARSLDFPNLSSVTTDDARAAAFCVRYLAQRGHRYIAVLGGVSCGLDVSAIRFSGCQQGFADCGLPFLPDRQYRAARFSMAGGYSAMTQLLTSMPEMTAVFAFSDVMAIGALRALRDRGRRVPEDISLIGYDGVELGRYSAPRLTTLKQDDAALAHRGAELLLAQIERNAPAFHETVPFRLLEGESVRHLREREH